MFEHVLCLLIFIFSKFKIINKMGIPRTWPYLLRHHLLRTVPNIATHTEGLSPKSLAQKPIFLVDGLNLAFFVLNQICSDFDLFFAPPLFMLERELRLWHDRVLTAGIDEVIYVLEGPRWRMSGYREDFTAETSLLFARSHAMGVTAMSEETTQQLLKKFPELDRSRLLANKSINGSNYFALLNQLILQVFSSLRRARVATSVGEADEELMRLACAHTGENYYVVSSDSDFCFCPEGVRLIRLSTLAFDERGALTGAVYLGSSSLIKSLKTTCGRTRELTRDEFLLIPGLLSAGLAESLDEAARMIYDNEIDDVEMVRKYKPPETYSITSCFLERALEFRKIGGGAAVGIDVLENLDVWKNNRVSRIFFEAIIDTERLHRRWPEVVVKGSLITWVMQRELKTAALAAKARVCARNGIAVTMLDNFVAMVREYYLVMGSLSSAATTATVGENPDPVVVKEEVGEGEVIAAQDAGEDIEMLKLDEEGGEKRAGDDVEESPPAELAKRKGVKTINSLNAAIAAFINARLPTATTSSFEIQSFVLTLLRSHDSVKCNQIMLQTLALCMCVHEREEYQALPGVSCGEANSAEEAAALHYLLTFNCLVQMTSVLVELKEEAIPPRASLLTIEASLFMSAWRIVHAKASHDSERIDKLLRIRFGSLLRNVEEASCTSSSTNDEEEWEKPGSVLLPVPEVCFCLRDLLGDMSKSVSGRCIFSSVTCGKFNFKFTFDDVAFVSRVKFTTLRNNTEIHLGWGDEVRVYLRGKAWAVMERRNWLHGIVVQWKSESGRGKISIEGFPYAVELRKMLKARDITFKYHEERGTSSYKMEVGRAVSFRAIFRDVSDKIVKGQEEVKTICEAVDVRALSTVTERSKKTAKHVVLNEEEEDVEWGFDDRLLRGYLSGR